MPRNSSGTYSLPAGNPVVPNTLIETTWANPTMSDIGAAITDSLDRYGRGGMLAQLKLADGTAAQPAFAFNSESSTGLFRPGAGSLALSVLGAVVTTAAAGSVLFTVPPSYAADPASGNELTRKAYVDAAIATAGGAFLPLIGGTLTGPGNLVVAGTFAANGGVTLGDALGDALTINSNTAGIPNGLNLSGSVGVNAAPLANVRLTVDAGAFSTLAVFNSTNPAGGAIRLDRSGTAYADIGSAANVTGGALADFALGVRGTNKLILAYNSVAGLTLDGASGNVGIGRNPTARLDVAAVDDARLVLDGTGSGLGSGGTVLFYRTSVYRGRVGIVANTLGNASTSMLTHAVDDWVTYTGAGVGTERLRVSTAGLFTYSADGGAAVEVGFRSIPRTDQAGGSAANGIRGRMQSLTSTATYTIPANVFTAGDVFSIINFQGTSLTIAQGASLTMHLSGTTTTGNRTLGPFGTATVWFSNGVECFISGAGVS